MVEAFVLVQVEMGRDGAVTAEMARIPGVLLAQSVTGPYDVIARAEGPSVEGLSKIVNEIQRISGVVRTLTCTIINV